MLCLGPKKNLSSPRHKLIAQARSSVSMFKVDCEDHLAIQVPLCIEGVKSENFSLFSSARWSP